MLRNFSLERKLHLVGYEELYIFKNKVKILNKKLIMFMSIYYVSHRAKCLLCMISFNVTLKLEDFKELA